MIVNCATIFLSLLIIFVIFLLSTSKRQNVCVSFSFGISFVMTFIVWLLDIDRAVIFIHRIFNYHPNYPTSEIEQIAFSYGLFLLLMFIFFFFISFFLLNKFYPKDKNILKKNGQYYLIKTTCFIINIIIGAFVLMFFLTDVNYIYDIPRSFLDAIMGLFERGLRAL